MKCFNLSRRFGALLLLFIFCGGTGAQFLNSILKFPKSGVRTLRYLPLKNKKVTISGYSAGAAFAMQLYLSYTKMFSGIALFHGVIYKCVEANQESFSGILGCVNGLTNLTKVVELTEDLADDGMIDPLKRLKKRRHYIEHGYNDEKFSFNNGRQIAQFFGQYSKHVRYQETSAIHGIATESCGFSCGTPIYLNSGCLNCGRSAVYQGLSYIRKKKLYKTESKIASCYQGKAISGLYRFSQSEFLPKNAFGFASIPMEQYGYIYIPPRCEANSSFCSLHVAFHGCSTIQLFGGVPWHITCSGYLEVAAANNIIVLFPQAAIQLSDPYSYLGCWDFVGYTGELYGTKRGSQVRSVIKMISRIMTPPREDFDYYDY
ncbi:unnamed protein product [Orchesella dallaii]|uniref:Poly(3-hydroxyalkanoate) depolymerase C n=1 Tax=Orchesella dallaii TaxID=48710 RepID=A0ABP1QA59_9HEXA